MTTLREELEALARQRAIHAYGAATGRSDYDDLAIAAANLALEAAAKECEAKVMREAGYGGQFGGYGGWDGDKTGPECAAAIRRMRVD